MNSEVSKLIHVEIDNMIFQSCTMKMIFDSSSVKNLNRSILILILSIPLNISYE